MVDTVVRKATTDDIPTLAALKVAWAGRSRSASLDEMRSLTSDLASWVAAHGDSLIAHVAARGDDLVGMAWLVIFDRVPDLDDRSRRTGDIQSVFVLPEHRRQGVGRALVASLLEAADQRRIARVTVSANASAAPLYMAAGFRSSPLLLERRIERNDAQ